jgi:hypothetical protein
LRFDILLPLVGRCIAEDIGDGFAEFLDSDCKTIGLVGFGHFDKGVTVIGEYKPVEILNGMKCLLGDVTKVLDLGLQTPVPLILQEERMLVEESKR